MFGRTKSQSHTGKKPSPNRPACKQKFNREQMEGVANKTLAIFCEIEDGNLTIYVEDNGTGMSDETKAKCFDEGYTTKESTGLGLFLAKQVIKKDLGGKLWLDMTRSDTGTRFAVSVPLL